MTIDITKLISKTWHRLIKPASAITKPEQRRQARLLSGLLVALIPLTIIGLLNGSNLQDPFVLLMSILIITMIGLYRLSRTKHYTLTAALTIGCLSLFPFSVIIARANYDPILVKNSLIWLLTGVLLGSVLLPLPGVALLIAATLASMLLLPFVIPDIAFQTVTDVLGLIITLSTLIMIAAIVRHQNLKQIEDQSQELQENETRFRSLFEATFEGIAVSSGGMLLDINPAFERLFGCSLAEVRGRPVFDFIAPEFRELTRQKLNTVIEEAHETVGLRADGATFNLELINKFHRYQGQFVQVLALRDITKRKQMEQALTAARDQALTASRMKSELVAKVSHELRTPLGAILGLTEMLQMGFYGSLSEKQIDVAEEVIESATYLTRIVNELLDQSKYDAGELTLDISNFAPADMIDQLYGQMSVLAEGKGLTLLTGIAPDMPPTLSSDPVRLQQILTNLIGNAIKFTDAGMVEVKVYKPNDRQWAMQVSDTGPGIPVEAHARIFEPFGQVDGSVTRRHKGAGLGLSIVKQLTELMGGEVTLESEVGRGSIFTVLLPFTLEQRINDEPQPESV